MIDHQSSSRLAVGLFSGLGLVFVIGTGCSTSTDSTVSDSTHVSISVTMKEVTPGSESAVGSSVSTSTSLGSGDSESEITRPEDSGFDDTSKSSDAESGPVIVVHVEVPTIQAFAEPDVQSERVAELANPTGVGGPLVFQAVNPDLEAGAEWLQVYLPVRPNGTTGWVRQAEVSLASNPYRIEIDVAGHTLTVYRHDELWLQTPVAIGTGATPTPIGKFYVIELLQPPDPNGPYGPFAFGLSGFSETLSEFAGGEGVIGIHGTNDPSSLGSDVSHGCIRMANEVVSELAGVLPLGTPVIIDT